MANSHLNEERFLHQLISFKEYYDRTAILFYDDFNNEEIVLSYEKLDKMSSDLSQILIRLTESRSCNVGIFCDQCEMLPVFILGILRASCCFVYLPTKETSNYLLNWSSQCRIGLILSFKQNFKDKFPTHNLLETFENNIEIYAGTPLIVSGETSIAYIMRTSGTTGQFKTVKVPHDAIVPNILHLKLLFDVESSDVVFLASPLTFDPSIVEIFVALTAGAKLLIVSERIKINSKFLAEILFEKFKISVLQITPSLFERFGDEIIAEKILSETTSLKVLTFGGEAFPCKIVERNLHTNNKTKIFNIYGITEVSCWATCAKITRKMLKKNEIPMGEPLRDTKIKLEPTTFGEKVFELYVGGTERKCILGSETLENCPEFRSTGDLVKRSDDGQLFFVGRTDNQVKRFGKKINLEEIASVVLNCISVDKSTCFIDDECLTVVLTRKNSDEKVSKSEFLKTIRSLIDAQLPAHSRPDRYFVLDQFPLTEHGKIDKKAVSKLFFDELKCSNSPIFSQENIFNGVVTLINEVLGENIAKSIARDSFLWNFGCDSVKSLQLVSKLECWCDRRLPKAFEMIIFKTVDELCNYLKVVEKSDESEIRHKRSSIEHHNGFEMDVKRQKIRPKTTFKVFQRANFLQNFNPEEIYLNWRLNSTRLKVEWTWNSAKCIDGSPLVVENKHGCSVFIGSHSHNLASIDAISGSVNWMIRLDGRIEGSAAVSCCGIYIIIGSYDSYVYFIERHSGEIYWRFKTDDIVKTTPCVSLSNDLVFVGCHDSFLYALNCLEKNIKWKLNVSSSVASSPCLDVEENVVFVATLTGWVHCVSTFSGEILWSKNFTKPIFAQLVCFEDVLYVCCVDGCIYFVDRFNGDIKRKFPTSGPIFNAPSYFSNTFMNFLIFGNNEGDVYCIDFESNLLWNLKFNDAISTSPYLFSVRMDDDWRIFCCLCSKNGVIRVLNAVDGKIVAEFVLSGEIFSSPVVWRNYIYVGCRNDELFCLKIFDE